MSITEKEFDWEARARSLTAGAGLGLWTPEVRAWLAESGIKRVLVACSGGADSVFLLCQLCGLRAELGLEVVVGHYNHAWRGSASDEDVDFVEDLARGLGCKFLTARRPEAVDGFTETRARALRLEFLRGAARESRCSAIFFGHQRDDILETQLQRLARGSGTEGLAAPRPVHIFEGDEPVHLRPVLDMSAVELRGHLERAGIPWREDASNSDVGIARNALRSELIPELGRRLNRDVSAGAARTRRLLEADATALVALARAALPEAYEGVESLARDSLRSLPEALARRALTAWLDGRGLLASLSAAGLDGLLVSLYGSEPRGRQSAGAGFVVFDDERIWCEAANETVTSLVECAFRVGEKLKLSTGVVLASEWVPVNTELLARLERGEVNPSEECFAVLPEAVEVLEVRALASGDRYKALGAPGSRKLKDCLLDRGLGERERKLRPVVSFSGSLIVWVPGLPVSDCCRVGSNVKKALRLTYGAGEAN